MCVKSMGVRGMGVGWELQSSSELAREIIKGYGITNLV